MAEGLCPVVSDDDSLPGSETIILDYVRRCEAVQCRLDLREVRAHHTVRGRDPGSSHDVLCEGLAALELSGCGGGTEARDATLANRVGSAVDQGEFGADDDKVGRQSFREVRDRCGVCGVHRQGGAVQRDTGVAGRAHDLGHPGIGQQALDRSRQSHQAIASYKADWLTAIDHHD